MKMKDYPIGTRIGLGCGLLVAVAAVMAVLGWIGVNSVQSNLQTLYADYTVAAFNLGDVGSTMSRYRNAVLESAASKNQREFEAAAKTLPAIKEAIDKPLAAYGATVLRVSKSGRSEAEDLKKFKASLEIYYKSADGVISSLKDAYGLPDPDMQVRMRDMAVTAEGTDSAPKFKAATAQFGELLKTVGEVAKDMNAEGQVAAASAKWVLIGGTVVALILAAGVVIIISRGVVRPIAAVNAALHDIASGEGDLTKRLDVTSKDEVGVLCGNFNQFVEKLNSSMLRVAATTAGLAAAAEELSVNTAQLAKGGQEQAQQATQAAAAVEEMSATVTELAKNAQGVASTAQDANRAAGLGHDVVAGSITGITRLSETVKDSAGRIQTLGQRSDQIGEIVKVIEDIADQTNLLALNAAIEAARAGEQGRGFAVVADEVRKLAERTTKATKEIADTIRTIQGDTGKAVEAMQAGTKEAQNGTDLVNKAGERIGEIVGAVQTVTTMIQQMAAAIEQQSTATDQIAGNIEAVAAVAKRAEGGLGQVTQATTELARMAGDLQAVVGGFKLKG